jgi:hypothetical protein
MSNKYHLTFMSGYEMATMGNVADFDLYLVSYCKTIALLIHIRKRKA